MFFVGALQGNLVLNTKGFISGIGDAKNSVKGFKSTLSGITSNLRQAAREFRLVGAAATAGLGMMVRHAMQVEEAESLFEVSFGKMADDVRKWSDSVAESLGMAAYQVREGAGTFAVMTQSMGLSEEASASLSRNLVMLAADMASFYNLPHEEALMKLQAGLTGEAEPLKRLGVLVNETTIKQYALREGIIKTGQELTEQQKVVARYGVIMEQTDKAQGDLNRTATSSTNQFRLLRAQYAEMSANLGSALLPTVNRGVRILNSIVRVTRDWYEGNEALVGGLLTAGAGIAATITGLTAMGFVIGPLTRVIGPLTRSVKLLGNVFVIAWGKAIAPILPLLAAIAAVGVAAYALRAVWKQNVGGIKTEWERFISGWKGGVEESEEKSDSWLESLESGFKKTLDFILEGLSGIPQGLAGLAEFVHSLFYETPFDLDQAIREGARAAETPFLEWFTEPLRDGSIDKEVENLKEVAGGVAEQFKEDWANVLEWLKGQFPELSSTIQSLLEEGPESGGYEYEPFDVDALLAGIQSTVGGVGAEVRKEAKQFLEATKAAERLKQSLDPVRAAYQGILEDIKALNDAGSYTAEWQSNLADKWAEQLQDMDWGDVQKAMEGLGKENAQFADDVMRRIQAIKQEAKEIQAIELLEEMKPESLRAFDDMVAKIELLKETGNFDTALQQNLLAPYFWEQWGHLSDEAWESLMTSLSQTSVEADKIVQKLWEIRDLLGDNGKASEQMEASWSDVSSMLSNIGRGMMDLGEYFGSELLGRMGAVQSAISSLINAMIVYDTVMKKVGNTAMVMWMKILGPIYLVIAAITTVIELAGVFGDKSEEVKEGWSKMLDELGDKLDEWADRLTDAIIEFVKTGEFEFDKFLQSVAEDILRTTITTMFTQPLMGAIRGIFAKGAAFAGGEVVPFAKGGIATSPAYFPMRGGKTGLLGEEGPEAIMPLERSSSGHLGVRATGAGQTTVNVIDQRSGNSPPVDVQRRQTADGEEVRILIRDAVADSIARGDLDGLFGLTFGLRRGRA